MAVTVVTRIKDWKARARRLAENIAVLAIAVRDPRTPWYAKALAIAVVAYALSPLDLIPDFIPVLGYVDDLLILPFALTLTIRLIPRDVWEDCRARATNDVTGMRRARLVAAGIIVVVWLLMVAAVLHHFVKR